MGEEHLTGASESSAENQVTLDSTKSQTSNEQPPSQPKRTLFVRSLPASATTESLTEYFSQSYILKHATAVLDPETKQSKGYGFVTFADVEDAKAALEEFNGSVFEGKKIIVDYAQQRHRTIDENLGKSVPSSKALELKKQREDERNSAPPRLIVRNLPWSIKEPEDLSILFRSFGKVKHVVLPKKGTQLAGFGFVVLRGKKNAEKALAAINGKEVDGRTLAVDWAVDRKVWEDLQKKPEAQDDDAEEKSPDVEMAEADADGSDDDEIMSTGDDLDVDSEDDLEDEDEEDYEEEEEEKEDDRNASTIFIRNLPFTCTDESLYEHFNQFGNLRYARIVVDPETERPRGTGFVCFWKADDAMSCVRDAPKQQDTIVAEKDKSKKTATTFKHSILQDENADPSGRYTLEGRVLQISRAVSKSRAAELEEEGASRRLVRDTDKRRLFLLSEGTISNTSPLYKKLSPSEIKIREDSYKQRQNFIKKNPALHLSLTRLSIRNIPRHVTSKDLKQLARQAVVGFAKDVTGGLRQALSRDEVQRASEEMKEAETLRKKKGLGVVRQAKIVFESRDGSKVNEDSGAGRSRGYGFVEYFTHRHSLMALRWLNGHAIDIPASNTEDGQERKKRLIVEFAIENAQVVKRRSEQQARANTFRKNQQGETGSRDNRGDRGDRGRGPRDNRGRGSKDDRGRGSKDDRGRNKSAPMGQKRKRSESDGGKGQEGVEPEEQNKLAKRNRIIAKKRMQRRSRK
ncbi:RNA recognition motif-containing protein [Aspergillus nanangensis]|uniref:RNA recognition motif-containing protein n=1 Tax=Aspergillus nanangensis TaxID=2582783 RepID=A0AAD4GRN0_ASPNN|nr:RNA recognition motif-containing protein [Aspergillus nanangensis]